MVRVGREEHGFVREGSARVVRAGQETERRDSRSVHRSQRQMGSENRHRILLHAFGGRGKVFVGGLDGQEGIFVCFDAATGQRLWQWQAPPREVPGTIDGFSIGLSTIPHQIGVCSSAAVDGDRLYFVSNRCDLMCLDVAGQPPEPCRCRPSPRGVDLRHAGPTGCVSLRRVQRFSPHRRRSAVRDHLQRRGPQYVRRLPPRRSSEKYRPPTRRT